MPKIPEDVAAETVEACAWAIEHLLAREPGGWPLRDPTPKELATYLRDNRTAIIASVTKPGEG